MKITITERQSNIELLRIIAMFMILMFHANFLALGKPDSVLLQENPAFALTQLLSNGLTVICVDVFVLISGWFGIRPKLKSILNFIFLCLFFSVSIYVMMLLTGKSILNINGIKGCLYMLPLNNWFIRSYLCLYIIAPLINAFIDSSSKGQLRKFLIYFFLYQTVYVWLTGAALFFRSGYSTMSFIGLYALARYVRLYSSDILNKSTCLIIYFTISGVLALCSFIAIYSGKDMLMSKIFNYTNPLVITSSLCLLMYFTKLNFTNKFINWIAASSFAAYLLHANPNVFSQYFVSAIQSISAQFNGFAFPLVLFAFLIGVFICAVLIDQIRKACWGKLYKLKTEG